MKTTLAYQVAIAAPRALVWELMLGPESYRRWTAPFCAGTYYEGSWEQGARIRFLDPKGDGMVAEIAENRLHEFVSIRHLGEIRDGREDTTSEAVRAWAPAYENYHFADAPGGGTEVKVEVESLPDFVAYLDKLYPRALAILKAMCEATPAHVPHAIDYIEIPVTDLAAAKRFYAAAFGWEFNDYGPDYAGIRRGSGEAGGLRPAAEVSRGGPLVILYSEDLEASLAAVRAAGGEIVVEPFSFPGGRRFHFLDPSGNELAVWAEEPGTAGPGA